MANRPQKAEYQVQQNLIASILYTVRRVSVTLQAIAPASGRVSEPFFYPALFAWWASVILEKWA